MIGLVKIHEEICELWFLETGIVVVIACASVSETRNLS